MVLCPDHLIAVWAEEITTSIPDATIVRFDNWKGVVKLIDQGYRVRRKSKGEARSSGPKTYPVSTGVDTYEDVEETLPETHEDGKSVFYRDLARWQKPAGPEWILLGRNQAKFKPEFFGVSESHPGFDGTTYGGRSLASAARSVVGYKDKEPDKDGVYEVDSRGFRKRKAIIDRNVTCPTCSTVVRGPKGIPVSPAAMAKKQHECQGVYLKEFVPRDAPRKPTEHGLDILPAGGDHAVKIGGKPISIGGKKYKVKACGERLWNYNRNPYRYPPAIIIQKKLRGLFSHLLIDEVHEQKSDESAQSMAAGKLMAVARHTLALTGTIIGGRADHLFPLLLRLSPKTVRGEGFEWAKSMAWSQAYGKIERTITTKQEAGEVVVSKKQTSMRKARTGKATERQVVRPGIMPTMYGRHMLGNSIFIMLSEMESELPDFFEYVGGRPMPKPQLADFIDDVLGTREEKLETAIDYHRREQEGYFDTAVDMDDETAEEYKRIEAALIAANNDLIKRGSMKLLGAMLWTLMDYADKPYGWDHNPELLKGDSTPGLLGQSFLKNFDHRFDSKTECLVLSRTVPLGIETEHVPLRKEGGIYWLDVTFNGKVTKSLAYDTGASTISLSSGMAGEIGLKPKKGDQDVNVCVADGSLVPARATTIDSVTVGKFTVENAKCTIISPGNGKHTVGYYDKPNDYTPENWRGVVTPKSLEVDVTRPKEQKLIDICLREKKDGKQCWVYVNMTSKRDIQPRLQRLLEAAGLRVKILKSKGGGADSPKPIDRKEWIDKNGPDYDVIISNPTLVSTGLTLFSNKPGGHNYSTLIFYETGYNLFTLRQASRRAWRIGQPRDCRVYYLYYRETMQQRAMALMSRKMAAAAALEGEFSAEGLVGLSGEDNAQMAMAKSLKERIKDEDTNRNWSRKSGVKKKPKLVSESVLPTGEFGDKIGEAEEKKARGLAALTNGPVVVDALDDMPIEVQLAAVTAIELHNKGEVIFEAQEFEDYDWGDDDFEIPTLSREAMAKMMADLDEMAMA
jgi:clan AA aspartic protease (TIGR02281 family)